MGREVRLVPRGWEHPKRLADWRDPYSKAQHIPKHYGWKKAVAEFEARLKEGRGVEECLKYFGGPSAHDYMDSDWEEEGLKPELLVMYEDTSEGTPMSPAFETAEQLARWLADNKASAFGDETATYEQWLATCKAGWAISAEWSPQTGLISGVAAQAQQATQEKNDV